MCEGLCHSLEHILQCESVQSLITEVALIQPARSLTQCGGRGLEVIDTYSSKEMGH